MGGEETISQSFKSDPELDMGKQKQDADDDLGEKSVSQFFQVNTKVPESESIVISKNTGFSTPDLKRRSRSPVLKQSMFDSPELPGVDAVYINMLKDGDVGDLFDDYDMEEH